MYAVGAVGDAPYSGAVRPPRRQRCHPTADPGRDCHVDGVDPDGRAFSCFAWREMSLLPRSFRLQTHPLRDRSLRP